MQVVTIEGPAASANTTLRKQIATLLQTAGKTVRAYDDGMQPDPLPSDAQIVIIVKQGKP